MEQKASAEKVIESGPGVELTVAISPTALRESAIDVTPGRCRATQRLGSLPLGSVGGI